MNRPGFVACLLTSLSPLSLLALLVETLVAAQPLALHPANPHYFIFREKPMVIVTSGEHYGALLNLDFDFSKYLQALSSQGLNNTRVWSGAYCEAVGDFKIASNSLAPMPNRFICPWARSDQPGYANGGNKFDLNQWDERYFKRLKEFMTEASRHGVIVEMNLFCPFYEESMWRLSPMNRSNNINEVGEVARTNVYTLDKHGGLLKVQERMTKKIVQELKDFDNLFYEICNEPYWGGVSQDWQWRIAEVIAQTERELGARHLISWNVANGKAKISKPHPEISIFNFHYATPPDAVSMNYGLNRPIGDNETGFKGTKDAVYRMEGWDFIAAGGALYNNLDYSFVAGHEEGSFQYPASQPGGGSAELRRQLGFLSRVIHQLDFVHMRPDNGVVKAELPKGVTVRALVNEGKQYLVYLRTGLGETRGGPPMRADFGSGELMLEIKLPPGDYVCQWMDPAGCKVAREERFTHTGGERKLAVPAFKTDAVLTLHARK